MTKNFESFFDRGTKADARRLCGHPAARRVFLIAHQAARGFLLLRLEHGEVTLARLSADILEDVSTVIIYELT